MANAVTHQNPVRKALANLVVGGTSTADWNSGTAQKLVLYNGTPPANASAALSGNTACATITAIAWGAPTSSGVATISGSPTDPSDAGGTPTFFRLYRTAEADPSDVIVQGTVGTSGCDLNLSPSGTISAGAVVTLSGTYTAPV